VATGRNRLGRELALLSAAILLILGALVVLDGERFLSIKALDGEVRHLEARVETLKDEAAALERERNLLREEDLFAVERVARERYGMSRPGDRMYRVERVAPGQEMP
jgi:cell division protein FtsB